MQQQEAIASIRLQLKTKAQLGINEHRCMPKRSGIQVFEEVPSMVALLVEEANRASPFAPSDGQAYKIRKQ